MNLVPVEPDNRMDVDQVVELVPVGDRSERRKRNSKGVYKTVPKDQPTMLNFFKPKNKD